MGCIEESDRPPQTPLNNCRATKTDYFKITQQNA